MPAWLVTLTPPRETFATDMSDEEAAIMAEHLDYLRGLLADGRLVLAGPALEPLHGIAVFEADTEEEARRIMAADPAVSSGLQRAQLSPFRLGLLRGRD